MLKKILPITKICFVISLLVLFLWSIPTMVSYYKNKKLYENRVEQLNRLDQRTGGHLDAKPFHSEVFRVDAENYFNSVKVMSVQDNAYEVIIIINKEKISDFHTFLENISLNYAVNVNNDIDYEEVNKSMRIKMVIKPY